MTMTLNLSGRREVKPHKVAPSRTGSPSTATSASDFILDPSAGTLRIVLPNEGISIRTGMGGRGVVLNAAYQSVAFGWSHFLEGETEEVGAIVDEVNVKLNKAYPQHARIELIGPTGSAATIIDKVHQDRGSGRWTLINYKRDWGGFETTGGRRQVRLGELAADAIGADHQCLTLASLGTDQFKENASEVGSYRFTKLSDRQRFIAAEAFRDRWAISLGELALLLDASFVLGKATVCALMVERRVAIDLRSGPITRATRVEPVASITTPLPDLIPFGATRAAR